MDTFSTWMPIEKAGTEAIHGAPARLIRGIGSTEVFDLQQEKILRDGIDLSPLLKSGFINWNHWPGPANIIGEPKEAELILPDEVRNRFGSSPYVKSVTGFGLYTLGLLYNDCQRADEVWDFLTRIEKARASGYSQRNIGWSVEGLALQRNGPVITKFMCRHLAVTHEPVNTESWAEIVKSEGSRWAVPAEGQATDHFAFDNVSQLVKALSLPDAEPLRLQNLAGYDNNDPDVIRCAIYGKCRSSSSCYKSDGTFHQGRKGMLYHLATCKGYPQEEARILLTQIHKALM